MRSAPSLTRSQATRSSGQACRPRSCWRATRPASSAGPCNAAAVTGACSVHHATRRRHASDAISGRPALMHGSCQIAREA
jgi:hypothetical protein